MFGFKEWIKNLFKKKVLIYTAIGHDDYFRIINRLARAGLKYQIKVPLDIRSRDYFTEQNTQYDFYVYQEDEGMAIEALHKKL